MGWSRDSRDNSLAPTRGVYQRLNGELGLPGMDIEYYKMTYQYQRFIPLSKTWTLAFNGEVGTRGVYQRLNGELGLPGMDIEYYKMTYQYQRFIPLSKTWTLAFNGEVGYGDVYGSSDMFPFFKNFYVGGIGSVRGYESGTLGPKDLNPDGDTDNLGGDRMVNGSIELLAPLPGGDRTLRIFGFLDTGYAWHRILQDDLPVPTLHSALEDLDLGLQR